MSTKEASRRSPLHDRWALPVKERANWRCEGCGMGVDEIRRRGGNLEAAHILPHSEYPDRRYDPENGRALCTFRNRRHPKGLGNGYGCHNAMSGHWNGNHGFANAVSSSGHAPRRHIFQRHKIAGVIALFVAGILSTSHGLPHHALWAWGALAVSLALWPELGLATALWAGLLALGFHSHRIHAPATFYGYLGWLAALVGAWCACLGVCVLTLAHLLPALWRWVRR